MKTLEYKDKKRVRFETLEQTKSIEILLIALKFWLMEKIKRVSFIENFAAMFAYVSNRIPEISDDLYKIDDAMKAGFGWEHGPFKIWDAVGVSFDLI